MSNKEYEECEKDVCRPHNIDLGMKAFAVLYRSKGHEILGACSGVKEDINSGVASAPKGYDHYYKDPTLKLDPRDTTKDNDISEPPSDIGDLLNNAVKTTEQLKFKTNTWTVSLNVNSFERKKRPSTKRKSKGLGIEPYKTEFSHKVYTVDVTFQREALGRAIDILVEKSDLSLPHRFMDGERKKPEERMNSHW